MVDILFFGYFIALISTINPIWQGYFYLFGLNNSSLLIPFWLIQALIYLYYLSKKLTLSLIKENIFNKNDNYFLVLFLIIILELLTSNNFYLSLANFLPYFQIIILLSFFQYLSKKKYIFIINVLKYLILTSNLLIISFFALKVTAFNDVLIGDETVGKFLDMISPFGIYLALLNRKINQNHFINILLLLSSIILLLQSNFRTSQLAFILPILIFFLGRLYFLLITSRTKKSNVYFFCFGIILSFIVLFLTNFNLISRLLSLFDITESRSTVGRLENTIDLLVMGIDKLFFLPRGLTSNLYASPTVNILESSNFLLASIVALGFISYPIINLFIKELILNIKILFLARNFEEILEEMAMVTCFIYLLIFPAPLHSGIIPLYMLFREISTRKLKTIF